MARATTHRRRLPLLLALLKATAGTTRAEMAKCKTVFADYVPTRDGAALWTTVAVPTEVDVASSAHVSRTYYNAGDAGDVGHVDFCGDDLPTPTSAMVRQDVRGQHRSQRSGPFSLFANDTSDAEDTLAWMRTQTWLANNSRVTFTGMSANGMTALYALATGDPAAAFARSLYGAADAYTMFAPGGAFKEHDLLLWSAFAATKPQDVVELAGQISRAPTRADVPWVSADATRPSAAARVASVGYHIVGYFDPNGQAGLHTFHAFDTYGAEGARARQRLKLGVRGHFVNRVPNKGCAYGRLLWPDDACADPDETWEARMRSLEVELLAGNTTGEAERLADRVRFYVAGAASCIGVLDPKTGSGWPFEGFDPFEHCGGGAGPSSAGNVWAHASSWPPPEARLRSFCFDAPDDKQSLVGSLATCEGARSKPQQNLVSLTADPLKPMESSGGANVDTTFPVEGNPGEFGFGRVPTGPADQGAPGSHGASFLTPVLTEPIVIAGNITATLRIHVEGPAVVDATVLVVLVDEYPDGAGGFSLVSGTARLAVARDPTERTFTPLVPGVPIDVTVHLQGGAFALDVGHRLRLDVRTGSWPSRWNNPQDGSNFKLHSFKHITTKDGIDDWFFLHGFFPTALRPERRRALGYNWDVDAGASPKPGRVVVNASASTLDVTVVARRDLKTVASEPERRPPLPSEPERRSPPPTTMTAAATTKAPNGQGAAVALAVVAAVLLSAVAAALAWYSRAWMRKRRAMAWRRFAMVDGELGDGGDDEDVIGMSMSSTWRR